MARQVGVSGMKGTDVSAFSGYGRASQLARLIVLEMVLWPGVLFVLGTALVAYRVRDNPFALAALAFATLCSAAVGVRQWRVMLRAVFPAAPLRAPTSTTGEDSPRLTSRGITVRRVRSHKS